MVPYQQEVDTILLIFKMYAAGEGGYSCIAQRLNELGIVSPRKAKKNVVRGWAQAAVRGILDNERYQGHVVFGKRSTGRNPETGKIVHPRRAESEWTTYEHPSLKIVPDELWEAVRARQAFVRDTFSGVKTGGLARSPENHSHLFSGLLRCGCCGGSMVLTNGSIGSYKCSNARPKNGCANNLSIRRESLQRQLIGAIALKLRSEMNLTHIKGLFMTELSAELKRRDEAAAGAGCQRSSLLAEQEQLVIGLENLANEIADHGGSESLRSAMRKKEARMAAVKNLLGQTQSTTKIASANEVEEFLRTAFDELAEVLLGDPLRTKVQLQKRIPSLTLTPTVLKGLPAYVVSGSVALFDAEELVMLPRTTARTSEHHSFVCNLDGMILKLDSRSFVTEVIFPDVIADHSVISLAA